MKMSYAQRPMIASDYNDMVLFVHELQEGSEAAVYDKCDDVLRFGHVTKIAYSHEDNYDSQAERIFNGDYDNDVTGEFITDNTTAYVGIDYYTE